MADVFISYARPTARTTRAIASALESLGYSVWFDEEIPAHRSYSDVISEQLESAKAVIVLWSKEAAASQWVRSEANRARENGTLVQARVDDTRLPMPFDQIQCVDLRSWRGDKKAHGWRSLSQSVEDLASSEEPPSSRRDRIAGPATGPRTSRRTLVVAGGAAAVAAAAGGLVWYRSSGPDIPPRAQQLAQKAFTIMQDGRPEEQSQATAYLIEATQLAPDFPRAWGALAITYALRKYQVPGPERAGNEARCRSAARRALELNSDEPFAQCSLALLVPPYRNWARTERMGRQLSKRHSDIPLTQHILADALVDAGRWKEAAEIYGRIDRSNFVIPLSDRSIIQGLWGAGDLQRAEAMLDSAAERWPTHRAIWNLQADFLMHTGRASEAIRLLETASSRPPGYPDDVLKSSVATARALAGLMEPAEAIAINLDMLATADRAYLTYLNHKIHTAQVVAQRAAALGDGETALELLHGYYFGRGRWAGQAPPAGDEDRNTVVLFEPPMSGLWRHPHFGHLLQETGLEAYWRASDSSPDFRAA